MNFGFLLCSLVSWWPTTGVANAFLLYPAASVIQITALVSAPIEIPGRKLYWDWGIQMNYDLPYNLQNFVNLPIWEGEWGNRRRRNLEELQSQDNGKNTWWHIAAKYNELNDTQPKNHPSDFTAGELYHDLENLLTSYGFHETCLLRSVCELARHPFDDAQQNLITEILTFLLTPSLHEAFSDSETMYREVYETAERRGFLHHNCADLYSECQEDLLTALTNVDMANNVNA